MANIYGIRLKEHLDDCWARRLDDWVLSRNNDDTTVLVGPIRDQAALRGLLCRVRDLGLTLLAVTCIEPEQLPAFPPTARVRTGGQATQQFTSKRGKR